MLYGCWVEFMVNLNGSMAVCGGLWWFALLGL